MNESSTRVLRHLWVVAAWAIVVWSSLPGSLCLLMRKAWAGPAVLRSSHGDTRSAALNEHGPGLQLHGDAIRR